MVTQFRGRKRRSRRPHAIQKPRGTLHPRVQAVGPEHFGIVSVDCAKARSKMMLADFYGKVLVAPTVVEHNRAGFATALKSLLDAMNQHGIKEIIVAIERTGRYHGPVQRAFSKAGLEVRIVHPFTTKQFRQPADPGNKTDDNDLSAIHRAAVNGFGLTEHEPHPTYVRLQLLARYRRKLVQKRVAVQQEMLECLESYMPGYARCFDDVMDSEIALWVAVHVGSAEAISAAGVLGLARALRQAGLAKYTPTVEKIVAWAHSAPAAQELASLHQRLFAELDMDRRAKLQSVQALECELAEQLVLTPYVFLLGIPGISVVSTAEFAGEAGPMEHYVSARAISGRAGLFPARYQSDQVDHADGALVRHANRSLRHAILLIAGNLLKWNDHFRVLAASWQLKGKDPRDVHVKIGGRFCRIAYQMVAGRQTYRHPCSQERHAITRKLILFSQDHEMAPDRLMRMLDAVVQQLPHSAHGEEGAALAEELVRVRKQRGAGPRSVAEILPAVLARLEVRLVRSNQSGESDPTQ